MKLTRSGWIVVEHPQTGEQHSRHVQEREAVESAATLATELALPVTIRYEQTVRVEVALPPPKPPSLKAPEWTSWGQTDITFEDVHDVTFGELR